MVSTAEEARIKFFTAKDIFNRSSINNKILIGNLTKWLYVGAQDSAPVKKYKLGNNLNAILRTMFNNYINLYTTQNPGHRFDFNLITSKGINGPSNWANFPNIIRDYLNSP